MPGWDGGSGGLSEAEVLALLALQPVCIIRTVSADLTIATDKTCLQRDPVVAAGVTVTIQGTGEWLVL